MLQSGIWRAALVQVGTSWFSSVDKKIMLLSKQMHVFMWLPT